MAQVDVSHPTSHGSNHHFDESGNEIRKADDVAQTVWDRRDAGGPSSGAAAAANDDEVAAADGAEDAAGVSGIHDTQKDSLFKNPGDSK